MYLANKHLPRRAVLKGLGATIALPFLDAMVPAGTAWAREAADGGRRVRLVAMEMVHGAAGSTNFGAKRNLWSPADVGSAFDLTPTSLASLEPYREYLTIVSNTDVRNAEAFIPPEIGGDHFRSAAVFLTQSHPHQTQGSDIEAGTSLDQLFAEYYGQETAIPSMQLCIENVDQAGGCFYGYSCAYTDSISWASPNEPLPMIRDPRVAFDMMFGSGGSPEDREARRMTRRGILDWIQGEVKSIRAQLGPSDRARIDRYLDNVSELERRIQRVEARNTSGEARELPDAPAGVPDSFSEHMKLMFDIQILALQTDMTRVIAFKMGRDAQNRSFPESGSSAAFHPASHHGGNEARVLEFNKICKYRTGQLAYFLEKMKTTMDGDASLLDKTMIVWGSPMADPNLHNHRRCPLVLMGRANGQLKGGVHIKAADDTPMSNVMLTAMHKVGMTDVTSFGDSTGTFDLG